MPVSESINVRGAVDLGALAAHREAQQKAATVPPGVVFDVTEQTFQRDVIEKSMTVPVVMDLWADWCQPCKVLTPVLEGLASDYAGRFALAKIDCDAEQRIAAAFQVQSIPSVFAVIKGQPLPLFQGALPAPQVKQYIEALLAEAAKAGVNGTATATADAPAGEAPAVPEPQADPDADAAYTAMENGEWATAEAAFQRLLDRAPGDPQAKAGLVTAGLYRRVTGVDAAAVVAAAAEAPGDVQRQRLAADVFAAGGDVDTAFQLLVDCVRVTAGDDRATARAHLLELFEVVGPTDPRVAKARIALANALF